jgi:hypothetical protein
MPDYSFGKIYTIRCRYDDNLIYVGSTVEKKLCDRMSKHRCHSKLDRCMNYPLYQEVNKTNWDNWFMELYEDYPCENKAQLNQREGQIIREIGTLNKLVAGRSPKEYRRENADKIKEKGKQYYHDNAEKIKESRKEYHRNNTEKIRERGKQYYHDNSEKINEKNKQYNRENAEKLKEYFKQYCQENAAKINEYKRENAERIKEWRKEYRRENAAKIHEYISEKIKCQFCGSVIARGGYARHTRTNKHIEKMKKND